MHGCSLWHQKYHANHHSSSAGGAPSFLYLIFMPAPCAAFLVAFVSSGRRSSSPAGSDRGSSIFVLAFLSLKVPILPTGVTLPIPVPSVLPKLLPFGATTLFNYGGYISPIFAFIILILFWLLALSMLLPPRCSNFEPNWSLAFDFWFAFVADVPLLYKIWFRG